MKTTQLRVWKEALHASILMAILMLVSLYTAKALGAPIGGKAIWCAVWGTGAFWLHWNAMRSYMFPVVLMAFVLCLVFILSALFGLFDTVLGYVGLFFGVIFSAASLISFAASAFSKRGR